MTKKTDGSKSKRSRTGVDNESIKLKLFGVIGVLVAIALVVGLAVGLPKIMKDTSSKGGSTDRPASSVTSSTAVYDNFPDDAGESALDWYLKLIKKLDKADLPSDFFNSDEAESVLDDFAGGNYSKMPKEVQDAVWFTDDTKQSEDRLVDYHTMKAAAFTNIIMSWQLYSRAVEAESSFKPDQRGVMVDKTHGQVVFPMETVCGLPASNVIVIDWTGSEWKVDGDITGGQIAAQVRTNQLNEKYQSLQRSQSQSSGSN